MIDINIIRTNRKLVEDNLKKKFQEEKLPLIDKILELDGEVKKLKIEGDNLRQERNQKSDAIGALFKDKKVSEANEMKEEVKRINEKLIDIEAKETDLSAKLKEPTL